MKTALDAYPFVEGIQEPFVVGDQTYTVRAFVRPELLDQIYISSIFEGLGTRDIEQH
jgi:hypothetical protein